LASNLQSTKAKMAKRVATDQKLDMAEAQLSEKNEPITYEKLRNLAGGGSNDTIQKWRQSKNDAPPAPEAVQHLARIAAQQIWAAANDEAMAEIARKDAESQRIFQALNQELVAVGSIREQLAGLNATLKTNLDESLKENAQLQVRLQQVDALHLEIVEVRAEVERRRSETEEMKIRAADATGQIKVLREQLKLRRSGSAKG
jgi:hypothetical protein